MPTELIQVGRGGSPANPTGGSVEKDRVVLVRPGVDPKAYNVPKGTTVAELLEHAGATMRNQILNIGEDKVEGSRVLRDGEFLFVVPQPKNA